MNKIILAITGASGSVYAQKLIGKLSTLNPPLSTIAVVFSATAREIWEYETGSIFKTADPAKEFQNDDFCTIRLRVIDYTQ
jgi:4-hydroxy-3-polyprenylbenzoate decarboxylase